MTGPDVYIVIDEAALAFDERREVIETVDWNDDGKPDWTNGCICDHRGAGGAEGYKLLWTALVQAEANARLCGYEPKPIPVNTP